LMSCLCFALFASAFNLLIGFTGLLSFGHAMFFGLAAYVCGHAAKVWGLTPEVAVLLGTLSATVCGVLVGWLAVRRQGIYFAMVTLALSQMIYFFCVQAPFTFAEDGIQSIPRGKLFGVLDLANDQVMYYFVLALFLAGFALIHRTIHSPFGQVLKSIRENEPRALSLGYNVDRYKLVAFVISATLAGMAGAAKSLALGLATLTDVSWQMSGEVVLMTLLGGMGTILGPALGATIVITMQNYLANLGSWVTIIMGLTFVVCVLVFRRGIVGEIEHRWGRKA
jgi:branched-chain amino acid transport system permease protein